MQLNEVSTFQCCGGGVVMWGNPLDGNEVILLASDNFQNLPPMSECNIHFFFFFLIKILTA